jgi:formylglycine-generating enzyme required for sulfatase activity
MHGNVFELCRDSFVFDLGSVPQTDPMMSTDTIDRVIRGGSFDRNALAARAAARVPFAQVGHAVYVGFRVVMLTELEP